MLPTDANIEELINILGNKTDLKQRSAAGRSLVQIGSSVVGPLLVALERGDNPPVQAKAARGLRGIAKAVFSPTQIGMIRASPLLEVQKQVRDLDTYLKTPDRLTRSGAARVLGAIGDSRAIDPLIAALPGRIATSDAAWALGNLRASKAIDPLIETICARHQFLARDVAGWIKARTLNDLALFEGAAVAVEIEAMAVALGQIGDPRAVDVLVDTLHLFYDKDVKVASIRALEKIGDKSAAEVIEPLLKHSNEEVSNSARQALATFGVAAESQDANPKPAEGRVQEGRDWSKVMLSGESEAKTEPKDPQLPARHYEIKQALKALELDL